MSEKRWYLRTQDETFGPETVERLIEWARMGRIQPGQEISDDNLVWQRVEEVPFLDMRFSIDIGDGNPRGPFNRVAAEALLASGRLPPASSLVETRAPFEPVAAKPTPAKRVTPPPSEKPAPAKRVTPPVAEKVVEVPVEKIVEKIVEKRVEVPVEKIVKVEKIVVDETRVKELEGLLEEERRHTTDLQSRMDEASRKSSAAAREAVEREAKAAEQIAHLEDELKRLPQAASEVAEIQSAMFALMTEESESIAKAIQIEKDEFEAIKKRYTERADHLLERRRELLKRSGTDIGDMTRKVLAGRPEDPRTIQLRNEFDEYRRLHEKMALDSERKIADLSEQLRICRAESARRAESEKDLSQILQENQTLRESLQRTEKELVESRQQNDELRRQQATNQQVLMSRLASLESPSVGTAKSLATNQSREAKMVKLPSWMRLKS